MYSLKCQIILNLLFKMNQLEIYLIKDISNLEAELEDYKNAFDIYKISFHSREESLQMIPIIEEKLRQAYKNLNNYNKSQLENKLQELNM